MIDNLGVEVDQWIIPERYASYNQNMNVSAIIITEGKREKMLIRAIASCIKQTLAIYEVIVVNDGIYPLHEIPYDERVIVVSTNGQEGLAAARQRGLSVLGKQCQAVVYLDDDDEFLPFHFAEMVPLLKKTPYAVSKAMFRHISGQVTTDPEPNNTGLKRYYDPSALLIQNIAPVSSFIHTKEAGLEVGWDSSIIRIEDWDFWGRMFIRYGPPALNEKITNVIYKHDGNLSGVSELSYSMSCSWRDIVSDRLKFMASENRWIPTVEDKKRFHIPNVGVVMPVHNSIKYLKTAIESIIDQTYSDWEILAINDASDDGSAEFLKELASKDNRIRIFDIPRSGVTKALNFGLMVSRSKYIARMDADDRSLPERFKKQVHFLEENNDVALVGSCFKSMDSNLLQATWINNVPIDSESVKDTLKYSNCIGHSTVMMRRRILEQIGGYRDTPEFDGVEDYELWLRMSKTYKLYNLPDFLLEYRVHKGQVSKNKAELIAQNSQKLKEQYA